MRKPPRALLMSILLGLMVMGLRQTALAVAVCGDGMVEGGEQCDDGGTADGDGCSSLCQLEDADGDGVADATEDDCPGYGVNGLTSGDGNADGILDSTQGNVSSLPAATGNGCITVVSTGCSQLTGVEAFTPGSQDGGDPGHNYPFGLVGFTLPTCESAQITVYYSGAASLLPGTAYRKYGPEIPGVLSSTKFYNLPGVTFGSANLNGTTLASATFTLHDNVIGDATGDDNTIVDPGGPAGAGHSVPAASNTGVMVTIGLLGLVGVFALRRLSAKASS